MALVKILGTFFVDMIFFDSEFLCFLFFYYYVFLESINFVLKMYFVFLY